jgi:hypothetical protein
LCLLIVTLPEGAARFALSASLVARGQRTPREPFVPPVAQCRFQLSRWHHAG